MFTWKKGWKLGLAFYLGWDGFFFMMDKSNSKESVN